MGFHPSPDASELRFKLRYVLHHTNFGVECHRTSFHSPHFLRRRLGPASQRWSTSISSLFFPFRLPPEMPERGISIVLYSVYGFF